MGLTHQSTGAGAAGGELQIIRNTPEDRVVALAGNPNVGKSTVFNALTKMNQHTGNWPGKTVTNAQGSYQHNGRRVVLVDVRVLFSCTMPAREVLAVGMTSSASFSAVTAPSASLAVVMEPSGTTPRSVHSLQ